MVDNTDVVSSPYQARRKGEFSKMQIVPSVMLPLTEIRAARELETEGNGTPRSLWFLWLPKLEANDYLFKNSSIKLPRNK